MENEPLVHAHNDCVQEDPNEYVHGFPHVGAHDDYLHYEYQYALARTTFVESFVVVEVEVEVDFDCF